MIAAGCYCSLVFSLLAPTLLRAGSPTGHPPLTVLMDFEAPHSEASLRSLRKNLDKLLAPIGYSVDVALRKDLPENPQFGQLVIFKMKGSCEMAPIPVGPLYDEIGPLAMAYTSDGQVLHFGEVECDRVRRSLQRLVGTGTSSKNDQAYGSALAVVIAHEIYHMLGNVRAHTHKGLTKPELSAWELMDSKLEMPEGARALLGKANRSSGMLH